MVSGARVSLADQAYLAIREEILRGQLRAGTRVWRERWGNRARPVEVPPGG